MLAIRRNVNRYAFALGLVLSAGLAYWTCAAEVKTDVPYVPTPEEVVDKMLELAQPKKGEILYDLGCGDGRIVITAAKKYGVKGIGVDIDPERISESNENAKTAGVTDRVKFIEKDLFEMDFHDANIVALYLLTSVNEKLRPTLLEQLKPGSRVVSHAFSMGDWDADEEVTVEPGGQTVYFWVIPAKVEGTWTIKMPAGGEAGKPQEGKLELKQEYQNVTGTMTLGGKKHEIKDAKLKGKEFTFTIEGADGKPMKLSATVDGDSLKGKSGKSEFTGRRQGDGASKKKHPIEQSREQGGR